MINRALVIIAGLLGIVICLVYLAIAVLLAGNPFAPAAPDPHGDAHAHGDAAAHLHGNAHPAACHQHALHHAHAGADRDARPDADAPTSTRTPTPRPEPGWSPPPPAPFQLDGDVLAWPNCGFTGVIGVVRGANGQPLKDVQLRVWQMEGWEFTWSSEIVTTDADGYYRIGLADGVKAGRYFVQVVANGDASWDMRGFDSSEGCVNGFQQFQMNWRRTS